MRAATPLHPVALPTPLFTRHMVGATEAERDRRSPEPHPWRPSLYLRPR